MKRITVLFVGLSLALVSSVSSAIAADNELAEAIVVKVAGNATVLLPGGAESIIVEQNMKLPAGALITTGQGGEVYLQPFSGTIAAIKQGTTVSVETLSQGTNGGVVTKQKTLLNLRSGSVISTLDPAKKAVTDYGVRTPKGVAAARGTSYAVNVNGEGATIAATADTVTFTTATGATYSIQAGLVSITLPGGEVQPPVPLASIAASNPEVATVIADAVQTLAVIVQTNLGGLSADSTANLAAQLIAVAAVAVPSQVTEFTAQLVSAMAAEGSSVNASADSAGLAIGAVIAAAAQSAPEAAAAIASAAAAAAPHHVGIISAAASQAVPGASAAIMQAVAQSTGNTVAQVQAAATQASALAASAVSAANTALQNVVVPPPSEAPGGPNTGTGEVITDPQPIDPSPVSKSS